MPSGEASCDIVLGGCACVWVSEDLQLGKSCAPGSWNRPPSALFPAEHPVSSSEEVQWVCLPLPNGWSPRSGCTDRVSVRAPLNAHAVAKAGEG